MCCVTKSTPIHFINGKLKCCGNGLSNWLLQMHFMQVVTDALTYIQTSRQKQFQETTKAISRNQAYAQF